MICSFAKATRCVIKMSAVYFIYSVMRSQAYYLHPKYLLFPSPSFSFFCPRDFYYLDIQLDVLWT